MAHVFETAFFNGDALKKRITRSVSDYDALKTVTSSMRSGRSRDESVLRPNMFNARNKATEERFSRFHLQDPWIQDMVTRWTQMSGLPGSESTFWREQGFSDALAAGRDIRMRTFLDDDGWAWIVVTDSPSYWLNRKRLPESMRERLTRKIAEESRKRY